MGSLPTKSAIPLIPTPPFRHWTHKNARVANHASLNGVWLDQSAAGRMFLLWHPVSVSGGQAGNLSWSLLNLFVAALFDRFVVPSEFDWWSSLFSASFVVQCNTYEVAAERLHGHVRLCGV